MPADCGFDTAGDTDIDPDGDTDVNTDDDTDSENGDDATLRAACARELTRVAQHRLAAQELSCAQLRTKLAVRFRGPGVFARRYRALSAQAIDAVITHTVARAQAQGLVDDARYARYRFRDGLRRGQPVRLMMAKLGAIPIAEGVIAEVLDQYCATVAHVEAHWHEAVRSDSARDALDWYALSVRCRKPLPQMKPPPELTADGESAGRLGGEVIQKRQRQLMQAGFSESLVRRHSRVLTWYYHRRRDVDASEVNQTDAAGIDAAGIDAVAAALSALDAAISEV